MSIHRNLGNVCNLGCTHNLPDQAQKILSNAWFSEQTNEDASILTSSLHHGLFLAALLSGCLFSQTAFAQDYVFKDQEGNEVALPKNVPIYSPSNPGPWKEQASLHFPKVKSKYRRDGLEKIRVLYFELPHPVRDEKLGSIESIFVLDKDGLIIGYYRFNLFDQTAQAKVKINGVINYVQIYIVCSRHGVWKFERRFDL